MKNPHGKVPLHFMVLSVSLPVGRSIPGTGLGSSLSAVIRILRH